MEDFYDTNFLMLMETRRHNILLKNHMEDFYDKNVFNADGDMPKHSPIESLYGKILKNKIYNIHGKMD